MHPVNDDTNEGPGRAIKVAPELPVQLEVEILSSKSKVSATVDGATVSVHIIIIKIIEDLFYNLKKSYF